MIKSYYLNRRRGLDFRRRRRAFPWISVLTVGIILVTIATIWRGAKGEKQPEREARLATVSQASTTESAESDKVIRLPEEYSLKVPFTSQAPHANWDQPYQDACEEAAVLQVHYFYQKKTFAPEIVDRELLSLVDRENQMFGDYRDTTAAQIAEFVKAQWGYERVEVIDNPTIEDIEKNLVEGRPVVAPMAGRMLKNPNFSGEGPLYHAITIIGYTKDNFVTNDVGTRKGEGYVYKKSTIMAAMHDWNGGDVESGVPRIVIIYSKNLPR